MTQPTAGPARYLTGDEVRAKLRAYTFHRLVMQVVAGKLRVRPDPATRRLTFNSDDIEHLPPQPPKHPKLEPESAAPE